MQNANKKLKKGEWSIFYWTTPTMREYELLLYLGFIIGTVWITIGRVRAILVIRPKSMDAKIGRGLPRRRIATTFFSITIWSWPLHKIINTWLCKEHDWNLSRKIILSIILPVEQNKRNRILEQQRVGKDIVRWTVWWGWNNINSCSFSQTYWLG